MLHKGKWNANFIKAHFVHIWFSSFEFAVAILVCFDSNLRVDISTKYLLISIPSPYLVFCLNILKGLEFVLNIF